MSKLKFLTLAFSCDCFVNFCYPPSGFFFPRENREPIREKNQKKCPWKKIMPVKIFENFCPWKKMLCPWKISNNLPVKVQKVCVKKIIIKFEKYINKYNFFRRCKQILFGYWGVIYTMYSFKKIKSEQPSPWQFIPYFLGRRS